MLKNVLITGAAGFLGSQLCDRFIKEGFYVIGMDNFITGDIDNINHLFSNPKFNFIEHDVTKHIRLDQEIHFILHFCFSSKPH